MRIILADDSAIIRAILEQYLKRVDDIEITDSVSNGRKALDSAKRLYPDVVILDSNMPEMDGIEATNYIKQEGIPVIVLAETQVELAKANAAGATASFIKPPLDSYDIFLPELVKKIKDCAIRNHKMSSKEDNSTSQKDSNFKILCIGASTGGPTAVHTVLEDLGPNFPLPILYAQHIEVGADKKMAGWLNESCKHLNVKLAKDGEEAKAGTVYMAPADKHLVIEYVKSNGNPIIRLSDDPPMRFLRPAVDKLFFSAAERYKNSCLAILLTGMGRDGADGCKAILDAHGYTIVEDESTCAVFGMPAAAIEVGGAGSVLPRFQIGKKILQLIGGK